MPRQKPIEQQTLQVYEFGNKPLVFRRYENYVSCGTPTDTGDPSPEWWKVLESEGMKPETTLVVTAHGDSMMPDIGDGDIVFIDTAATPTNGDNVLVYIDDEALIKEYQYNSETRKLRLIPLNRRYEVIELSKRSTRLKVVGVVIFCFHLLRKKKAITLGNSNRVKRGSDEKFREENTLATVIDTLPNPRERKNAQVIKEEVRQKLHQLIDGKKGKAVALAIYCAAKLGLIGSTDYNSVTEEFGDIGSRQNYNKNRANPNLFTPQEIESTQSFLTSTP